jgi:hypothetical protein
MSAALKQCDECGEWWLDGSMFMNQHRCEACQMKQPAKVYQLKRPAWCRPSARAPPA